MSHLKSLIAIVIFCCPSINTLAQSKLSKSEIKTIYQKVETAYAQENSFEALQQISELRNNYAPIDANTYGIWLAIAYNNHDLQLATSMVQSLNREPKRKKLIKKSAAGFEQKVDGITLLAEKAYTISRDQNLSAIDKANGLLQLEKIDSSFWQLYSNISEQYFLAEEYGKAASAYKKVMALNPKWTLGHLYLAKCHFNNANYEKALVNTHEFNSIFKPREEVLKIKYISEYNLGLYNDCIKTIKSYLKVSYNVLDAYNTMKSCAQKLGNTKLQVKSLLKLAEHSRDTYLLTEIASFYRSELYKNEISSAIDSLIISQPKELFYYLIKTTFYRPFDDDNYTNAIDNYNDMIALKPESWFYYFLKGEYLYSSITGRAMDKIERERRKILGIEALNKSAELNPDNYKTYDYLCHLNIWYNSGEMKRYKKMAYEQMTDKIERLGPSGDRYFDLAEAYNLPVNGYGDDNKYRDSTLKYYDLALQYGKDSFTVLLERRHEADCNLVLKDCLWLIKNSPNSHMEEQYYYTMANCYSSQEDYNKEMEIYMMLRETFPSKNLERRIRELNKKI